MNTADNERSTTECLDDTPNNELDTEASFSA
jgi:hypothetical protein